MIADDGKEIVEIPITDVRGEKHNVDGSERFKLFAGPYHGWIVRVYKPYMRIVWNDPKLGIIVYDLHPPVKAGGKWVYMYDPDDKNEMTEEEAGDAMDPLAQEKWHRYLAWKKEQDLERLDRSI